MSISIGRDIGAELARSLSTSSIASCRSVNSDIDAKLSLCFEDALRNACFHSTRAIEHTTTEPSESLTKEEFIQHLKALKRQLAACLLFKLTLGLPLVAATAPFYGIYDAFASLSKYKVVQIDEQIREKEESLQTRRRLLKELISSHRDFVKQQNSNSIHLIEDLANSSISSDESLVNAENKKLAEKYSVIRNELQSLRVRINQLEKKIFTLTQPTGTQISDSESDKVVLENSKNKSLQTMKAEIASLRSQETQICTRKQEFEHNVYEDIFDTYISQIGEKDEAKYKKLQTEINKLKKQLSELRQEREQALTNREFRTYFEKMFTYRGAHLNIAKIRALQSQLRSQSNSTSNRFPRIPKKREPVLVQIEQLNTARKKPKFKFI